MKPIVLTEEAKQNAIKTFMAILDGYAGDKDLKVNITTATLLVDSDIKKPTVYFTSDAYLKMVSLIKHSSDELAWHGKVVKVQDNYLIKDILVYPQEVTSVTVDANEEAYAKWLMELDDDSINTLRFQGHSHVNMGTSPSGRDTDNWQKFLNLLKPGEFYLFCIGNKREEFYWNIYDTEKNVLFENADIAMCILDAGAKSIKDWSEQAIKDNITKRTPAVSTLSSSLPYGKQVSVFNGQTYETPYTRSYYTGTEKTISIRDAKDAIPIKYDEDIEYEPETDMYYTYRTDLTGFMYSNLYDCYAMEGDKFRKLYRVKKPKKETKKQVKGGSKNESK